MPFALLSLLWTSLVALLVTASAGLHLWGAEHTLRNHVISALTATTLALFAHTMTMFYFIGSAKKIKEFVSSWEPEIQEGFRTRMISTKRKLFPWMLLICFAVMSAFILGGAFDAKVVSRSTHSWAALVAIVLNAHVCALETIHIFRNIDLIREVNERSRKKFAELHPVSGGSR